MKLRRSWVMGGLALAAAGVSVQASAQSSVTIYGAVDDALVYSSNQGGPHNVYLRTGNLAASKIGFKGAEDLGGGLQTVFTLENGFDINSGAMSSAGTLFNRQAFVGLSSSQSGALLVGRQYTPYYLLVGALGPTNVLTGATGAHPGDVDDLDTSIRVSNAVTYNTPVFGGVQVSALYGFGETAGNTSAGNAYSLAAKWDVSAWNFAVGYQRLKTGVAAASWGSSGASSNIPSSAINAGYQTADNVQMIAAATRYTIGNLMLGANYSNAQYRPGTSSISAYTQTANFQTLGLISSYKLTPQVTVAGGYSYTWVKAANGITDPAKYHQISLEQTYAFSPRTSLYLLEAYQLARGQVLSSTGTIVNATASVGDQATTAQASSGRTQTVLMLGIRHLF